MSSYCKPIRHVCSVVPLLTSNLSSAILHAVEKVTMVYIVTVLAKALLFMCWLSLSLPLICIHNSNIKWL